MGKRRVRLVVFVRHGANIYNHLSVRKMDGFGIVTEWSCRLTLPMIFRRSNVLVVTMSASWWNIHQKTDQVTDWRNRARGSAYFLIGEDEHRADGAGNVARLVHWLSLEMKISLRPLDGSWRIRILDGVVAPVETGPLFRSVQIGMDWKRVPYSRSSSPSPRCCKLSFSCFVWAFTA